MNSKIEISTQVSKKSISTIDEQSLLYQTIIQAIEDKKGENIVALDLRNIEEAVSSYFIVCDAQTAIQINTIVQHIVKEVSEKAGENPYHTEEGSTWSLVDYVNIVVHVFQTEERKFYDLEGVWLDAKRKEY